MRVRSMITIILGGIALAACTPRFDPQDPAALAAIDSIVQVAMEGSRNVDADKVLSVAAPDVTFITGDVMLSGIDSVRASFAATYAGLQSQQQTLLRKHIRLLSPDVALATAIGEGTYTDKAGWTSDTVGIGTTLIFVRENGQWRIQHAHQSIAF